MRRRLLLLYPPGWRARYGEEFLATVEHGPLRIRDVIDIALGALDAWFSTEVRQVTAPAVVTSKGGLMSLKSVMLCNRQSTVTPGSALVGAAVMLAGSIALKSIGRADLAFVGPFTLSMPFWLTKGQSWKAQAVIVGGTLTILILIG